MPNGLYKSYREQLLEGVLTLSTEALDVALIDEGGANPALETHDFYDDIVAGEIARFSDLTSKTVTDGIFDAADVTFTTVSGNTVEDFTIFEDDTTDGTSSLIVNFDTATGLPLTPNGADVTLQFDGGANKIFAFAIPS